MYQKIKGMFDEIVLRIKPVTRPSTIFVKERTVDKELIVVEIGTEFGFNALTLLRELPIKRLFLIDSYKNYTMKGGTQVIGDIQRERAMRLLSKYKNKIEFIRKYSQDAIDDIPDGIDFCYIDANHDYEYVKNDIELYYKKIKKGGVLAGHDFSASFIGVCEAVIEFSKKNNIKLYGDVVDWWVIKR